ncbi:MAG: phosphotransferase family protein [Nevskiaceae bacterium]|nr:MAG: phosphotransferase family protein [Nevskiaceae bacterium]
MSQDFSGTKPVDERQQFDVARLEQYLKGKIAGFEGPLTVEQFKGGQSNPTFKLITPEKKYVLRRKPAGKLLASAHAVDREYKVITALLGSEVPVARTHVLCEDDSVIGTAFYVMDCVEGRVMWDPTLPGMTPEQRSAIFDEMNRVIAALHCVDYAAIGLADYGKPGNYFARQIDRWSKQYRASETKRIEAFENLMLWLPKNIPAGDETSIVHGDYRLDNMIFHPTEPRVLAVLDWELSTLGHPLADFSYHCMTWHIPKGVFRGLGGAKLVELGIPLEPDYVSTYCRRTGRDGIDANDWDFYMAYNLFRLGAILQGIAGRVKDGTAASAQAKAMGEAAGPLAELGWKQVEKILGRR